MEGPGFEHSVFDVCGHSPLVKFFLKSKHLRHKKEHSTLVKRTEISEQPPAQALCYKDILDQSKDFEKKNQAAFRRLEINLAGYGANREFFHKFCGRCIA